jgi:hypothetical protein
MPKINLFRTGRTVFRKNKTVFINTIQVNAIAYQMRKMPLLKIAALGKNEE